MNCEELFLKLMIRRYLMKYPDGVYRSLVVQNFWRTPRALLDQVLDGCISEGVVTLSKGERGAVRLAWNDTTIATADGSK